MEAQPKEIRRYITIDGKVPLTDWLESFGDLKARTKIESRLKRVGEGNLGDYRSVGEGVCEFKIDYGPGYQVYFGQLGSTIVLLLCGGDKSTQDRDILTARKYWREYRSQENA